MLGCLYFFRQQGCFGSIGNRFYLFRLGMPVKQFLTVCCDFEAQFIELLTCHINRFIQQFFRSDDYLFAVIYCAVLPFQYYLNRLLGSGEYLETHLIFTLRFYVHQEVFACILNYSQFTIRQEILHEALFLVRLQPGKVRLILGVDTCHQFDVWAVFISQITIPGTTEITVSPCPLLLTRRNMVIGYVKHTCMRIVLISTFEIIPGIDSHVRSRYFDIFIVRDVYSGRIVHFVISARGNREAGNGPLSMIEHRINIGWEYTLIMVVHRYGRICPPQESLRYFGTVVEYSLDFEKSMSRTKSETCHPFLMKHTFHFIDPHSYAAVCIFFNRRIYGHVGTGTVMLGPVKFNAP